MASLSYLQPHIDAIHARAEAFDVPTPVIDALQELFRSKFIFLCHQPSLHVLIHFH